MPALKVTFLRQTEVNESPEQPGTPPRKCAGKPESKKCNCLYCALKGGADGKPSSSAAVQKPSSVIEADAKSSPLAAKKPSLVGNPKYKPNSLPAKESTVSIIGNGSITIRRIPSVENSSKRIAPKSGPKSCIPSTKEEQADSPTLDPSIQKELHKCVCGNSYSRRDHLQRHVKFCEIVKANKLKSSTAASGSAKIKCECGMGFDCVYNLVRHKGESCVGRKPAEETFKCECRFVFNDYSSFLNHQKTACKRRERVADSTITDHQSVSREGNFKCECGLSYSSYNALFKHKSSACVLKKAPMKIEHQELSLSCKSGQTFARTSDLSRHESVCDLRDADVNEFDSDVEVKQEEEEDEDDDDEDYSDSNNSRHSRTSYRKRGNTEADSNSYNKKPSNRLSCSCGESYNSYGALLSHQNDPCLAKDSEAGGFSCACGREFPRLCYLARHITACRLANTVLVDAMSVRCQCGAVFARQSGLIRHKKTSCSLRKKVLPSSFKSSSKTGDQLRVTKSKLKVSGNRCKCGAQFTMSRNLHRHIQRSCPLYKVKSMSTHQKSPGRPPGSKRVHIRGSRVVQSKKWGIVRGPPFVCTCGASYLNYESFSLHKRTTCKIIDAGQTGKGSKPQRKSSEPANDCSDAKVKLERVEMKEYPQAGSVFDLSTAVKFRCVCGQEFYSKFALNSHSSHCKDFLAMRRPTDRCTICNATFSSRAHMVRHVKNTHSGVSNIKVGAKVRKIVAKSPKSRPKPQQRGPVIEDVMSLA